MLVNVNSHDWTWQLTVKKLCCLRVGSRCDAVCGNIVSASGQVIAWVTEMRYLGVYVTQSRTFECSLEHAKCSFYRAANAVFAQVGRVASEEVTLHLFKSKCLLVPLYGLEVCPLVKSQISSLDFAVNLSLIHISEPTRQAEISYAVFCLKKKKKKKKK